MGLTRPGLLSRDRGRTHNTDISDSWEREGDDPGYFYAFSPRGYAFGINVLLYSLIY